MNVLLNGSPCEMEDGTSLESAVLSLGWGRKGLAAAVNGEVVPVSRWASTPLSPGDRIEILGAAPGG